MNYFNAFSKTRLFEHIKRGGGVGTISACRLFSSDFLKTLSEDEIIELSALGGDDLIEFIYNTDYAKKLMRGDLDFEYFKKILFSNHILVSPAENRKRTKFLETKLRALASKGIGYRKVVGVYEGTKEASFFVFNYGNKLNALEFKKRLFELAQMLSQDSITFSTNGDRFELICTTPFKCISWGENAIYKNGDVIDSFDTAYIIPTTKMSDNSEDSIKDGEPIKSFDFYSRIASIPFVWINKKDIKKFFSKKANTQWVKNKVLSRWVKHNGIY